MSGPRETEQLRAALTLSHTDAESAPAERLEWQGELDSAMADLDSKLSHPRRRASDVGPQPTLPELGQFDVTKELLDEIAWRVAEQLRRAPVVAPPPPPAVVEAVRPPAMRPAPVAPPPPAIPEGAALVLRLRRPLFSWPFGRRKSRRRQSGLSLSDYNAT